MISTHYSFYIIKVETPLPLKNLILFFTFSSLTFWNPGVLIVVLRENRVDTGISIWIDISNKCKQLQVSLGLKNNKVLECEVIKPQS